MSLRTLLILLLLAMHLGPSRRVHASPKSQRLEPLLWDAARRDARTVRRAHPASNLEDGTLRLLVRLTPGTPLAALWEFSPEAKHGQIVTVRVAPSRLANLEAVPGVAQVEACRVLRPHLDRSLKEVGASTTGTNMGLDGRGVVVGIVDTGLDFRHRDFQDAAGRTRLLYLLDFSQKPSSGGPGEKYGARVYTKAEINAQLQADAALGANAPLLIPHQDLSGHGTHVAGIATGTGLDAAKGFNPGRYVGVAPGAHIIAVQAAKKNDSAFHDADVLSAIKFIFDQAAALGLPAVVNLSLGTQLGPHDGTSNLANAISAFTGPHKPGKVIVASAGNDGGRDIHASGYPRLEGEARVTLEIPDYTPTSARELVHLEIWYDGTLDLALTSPAGKHLGTIPTGESMEQLTDEGLVKLLNAPSGPYKGNGRNQAVLVVDERDDKSPAPGRWTLTARGDAERFDVWLVNPAINGPTGRPRLRGPLDPDIRLSSPGTARGVITVAAYNTRTAWESMAGKMSLTYARVGEHAYFSATGPALDGRFIPDVSAPGQFITSAMSRHAQPLGPRSSFYVADIPGALWAKDQTRGLLRGTSQAAPHVTGVVALLLQKSPRLTIEQVRELLRVGARCDGPGMVPGAGWSPRWGFGKLDAARSLAALSGASSLAPDATRSTVGVNRDLLPAGSSEHAVITVVPRDAGGNTLGSGRKVQVTTSVGYTTPAVHRAYGRYEAVLLPRQARLGQQAVITVEVDGVKLTHQPVVHLTTRRALVGGALRATGGGCAVVSNSPIWGLPMLVLVALVLVRGRSGNRGRGRGPLVQFPAPKEQKGTEQQPPRPGALPTRGKGAPPA